MTPSSSSSPIIFEPYPKQLEFIEAVFSGKYSFLCYGGAMGGGKSFVCLAVAILLAKVYPGSIWCVIRESLPTLKKTSLATFMKVCPKQFIAGYNQQDQTITFTNGSKMLFMAEDYANDKDFDRFKGLEVSGFVLEQIEELNEGLLDVCFIRAGRHKLPKQPPPLVIANVNPTLMWPKAKIYDAYNAGALPNGWYYLPAKITDNPALFDDKAYMDRLANLDALTRRRLIDGDWTAFAVKSPFLYSFSLAKHEIESYSANLHLPIIVSFDFNKDPMTCLVGQSIDIRHLCIFDEMKIPNGSTPELCDMLVAKYAKWLGQIYVTGDASGHSRSPLVRGGVNHYIIIKKALGIKDGQFWVRKQNLSHINSRVLCNSVLQNANFSITKNCKETVADCVYASVDEEGELIKTVKEGRHCFIGSTPVMTVYGPRPINQITAGDMVMTRFGFMPVVELFDNGLQKVCEVLLTLEDDTKITLQCTPDHKVMTNQGWLPISQLSSGLEIYHANYSTGSFTNFTETKGISSSPSKRSGNGFISLFGNIITGLFGRALKFITAITTRTTIDPKIYRNETSTTIDQNISKNASEKTPNGTLTLTEKESRLQLSGAKQRKANGFERSRLKDWRNSSRFYTVELSEKTVITVGQNFTPPSSLKNRQDSVLTIVKVHTEERQDLITLPSDAPLAEGSSWRIGTRKLKTVHVNAVPGKHGVFDLHVDGHHEYFAGNLLVHNCFDNVRYMIDSKFPDFITRPTKYQ